MKTNLKFLSAALLTAVLAAAPITAMAAESTFGAGGAAGDADYTLDEMLTYAIQDEYLAQAEYDAIMDQYGVVRPFSNIIKAEATHISLLLPLFTTHDVTVPENDAADRTVVPATLAESYAAGVDAEIKNIAMYESFLKEDLPADVEAVFERLQAASENHLAAFERAESGDFQGTRNENGNGSMNGNVNGLKNGSGSMNGNVNGQGNGQGNGSGAGNGTGLCNGTGAGAGNGPGNGLGNGPGNGLGNGTGVGNGGSANCLI